MPLANKLSNKIAGRIMSFLTGTSITDPQSGFRALDGKIIKSLELKAERYAIEHIMILEAVKKSYIIKEVGTSCIYGEEESHINIFSDTIRVIQDILKFMVR
jgi:hypothetical protein